MREWCSSGLCVCCHGMGWGRAILEWGRVGLTCMNYRYPPRMIPEIDIVVCTTATNDKDARLLLSSMGVPFHGKHVN